MIRSRVSMRLLSIALWILAASVVNAAPPVFQAGPTVVQNPNKAVPLAAILLVESDQRVATTVTVDDGERTRDIEFDANPSSSEGLPLLGLRAGRMHTLTVTATNDAGEATTAEPLSYITPPLPDGLTEFPTFTVVEADVERMEPGIRFLSVRRRIPGRINWHTPNQFRFEVTWPSHGHNPRVTKDGTIVMFDNGIIQARPFRALPISPNDTFSRGVEYDIDEENMTVRRIWASASELNDDSCNSFAMGDTHRLPQTDNMLVIYTICLARREGLQYNTFELEPHVNDVPSYTKIREYTRTNPPEIVSEIIVKDENDILVWQVYGGLHVESLYPQSTSGASH